MKTNARLLSFMACLFVLPSCALKLSSSQREKMTAIQVPDARIKANAYTAPNFTNRSDASNAGMMSAAVGFGLVGALVSEIYVAAERAGDVSQNRSTTAAISKLAPSDLGTHLGEALRQQLKQSSFYGPKLTPRADAPAKVDVLITSFRLASLDDLRFTPVIQADVTVTLNGKSIFKKTFSFPKNLTIRPTKAGPVPHYSTLRTYAGMPNLLKDHFHLTARQLAQNIAAELIQAAGSSN